LTIVVFETDTDIRRARVDTAEWTTAGPFAAATQPFVVTTNRPDLATQVERDLRDLRCATALS